ncbi:MAG: Sec-independent protein translocase protein TatB [Mycobacteriaceae bacterium]
MFGNIGWSEFLILMAAGLFILGPERLPSAAAWLAQTLKQVREYATGAREQLKNELGPEFDELRKPLADLQQLRGFNPRTAITKHLLDGDDSFLFGPSSVAAQASSTWDEIKGAAGSPADLTKPNLTKPTLNPNPAQVPLATGERPPFDADAT